MVAMWAPVFQAELDQAAAKYEALGCPAPVAAELAKHALVAAVNIVGRENFQGPASDSSEVRNG